MIIDVKICKKGSVWEREEAAGARGGPAAIHHALQPRRLHGYDEPQQDGDQEEGIVHG